VPGVPEVNMRFLMVAMYRLVRASHVTLETSPSSSTGLSA